MMDHMDVTNQPTASPEQTLSTIGLNGAAEAFGISVDTLRRRIKSEKLPEAALTQGKFGDTYELPMADLAQIAEREGWILDLTNLDAQSSPSAAHGQSINFELIEQLTEAKVEAQSSTRHAEELERKNQQLTSDLENERKALNEVTEELIESDKAKAVAEARVDELRKQVDQAAQERDSLGQSMRELEESSAKSLSALSDDADSAKSDAEKLVGERNELAAKLAEAEGSMGWWTRRKYGKG